MRYFEQRKPRIEIIPMIDIMFFLLVFFVMVTLRMIPATGITSQLPHSSTAEATPHPKLLVSLKEDGSLVVENQPITLEGLTARLMASGHAADTAVTIASVQGAAVQQLIAVMNACRKAGVTQVALAATHQ